MKHTFAVLALLALPLTASPALAQHEGHKEHGAAAEQSGLFIRQGETWFFKIIDGEPAEARKGSASDKPGDGEIRVSLNGGMMNVLNGGSSAYNYQAYIARKPGEKGNRTSVCTLMPRVTVFESWPENLPGIRLTGFQDAGDRMGCF